MRRTLISLPAALMLLLVSGIAHAQFLQPFSSKEGLNSASMSARGDIGDDAILVYVASAGDFEYQGVKVEFDPANGNSTGWLYSFYSPSTKKGTSVAVIRPAGVFLPISAGDTSAIPLPADPQALNSSSPYFDSKDMVTRLAGDTAFQRFRAELPGARPKLVTLSDPSALDTIETPGGFPLDQSLWTLLFQGEGDSTMLCFVTIITGEAVCQRIAAPASSVPGMETRGTASLDVAPNPASDRVRVTLALPEGAPLAKGVGVALFNERGEHMLDLTGSLMENDYRYAEFDSRALPPGVYYCRAIGSGWSGMVGVVITR